MNKHPGSIQFGLPGEQYPPFFRVEWYYFLNHGKVPSHGSKDMCHPQLEL
jgi:hypothetical protein